MSNGKSSINLFRATRGPPAAEADRTSTTVLFSMAFFGLCGQALHGQHCQATMDPERLVTVDISSGAVMEHFGGSSNTLSRRWSWTGKSR
jgi:hypothetical protein